MSWPHGLDKTVLNRPNRLNIYFAKELLNVRWESTVVNRLDIYLAKELLNIRWESEELTNDPIHLFCTVNTQELWVTNCVSKLSCNKIQRFLVFDVVCVHKSAQNITKDNFLRLLEFLDVVISTNYCAEVAADTVFT